MASDEEQNKKKIILQYLGLRVGLKTKKFVSYLEVFFSFSFLQWR